MSDCSICVGHTLQGCHDLSNSQKHRGREATGIGAQGADGKITCVKSIGPPRGLFDLVDMHDLFPRQAGFHTFWGHTRYATQDEKDPRALLLASHPHVIGGDVEDHGDHLIITNADMALVHNGEVDPRYLLGIPTEHLLKTRCDSEKLLHYLAWRGPEETLRRIPGAYTLAFADSRTNLTTVLRDRHGIRPGVLGQKDGKHVIASEDIAFSENGARLIADLEPGSLYHLYPDGRCEPRRVVTGSPRRLCFFEIQYFSHTGSIVDGIPIQYVRGLLGRQLARRYPFPKVDLVTYLPRTPESAARAYADELGLPFAKVFYKPNSERSFIGSTTGSRQQSIRRNLHLLPFLEITNLPGNSILCVSREFLRGKTVLVEDDSLIRGNNGERAQKLLQEAGVAEIILATHTPPVGIVGADGASRGCNYGVDMHPDTTEFVSRGRTEAQISEAMGMTVRQLPLADVAEVYRQIGRNIDDFCTFCVGGPRPFE